MAGGDVPCRAERAGVTRGALHHHFRSKSVLLAEALTWGWTEYGDRLFGQDAPVTDAEAWLRDLLTDYVSLLCSDELFRALASTTVLVAPQDGSDTTSKHSALDSWRDRLAEAIASQTTLLPARTVAGLVLVLLQGFTVTAVTRPDDLPHPDDLGAAMTALVKGVLT